MGLRQRDSGDYLVNHDGENARDWEVDIRVLRKVEEMFGSDDELSLFQNSQSFAGCLETNGKTEFVSKPIWGAIENRGEEGIVIRQADFDRWM